MVVFPAGRRMKGRVSSPGKECGSGEVRELRPLSSLRLRAEFWGTMGGELDCLG